MVQLYMSIYGKYCRNAEYLFYNTHSVSLHILSTVLKHFITPQAHRYKKLKKFLSDPVPDPDYLDHSIIYIQLDYNRHLRK